MNAGDRQAACQKLAGTSSPPRKTDPQRLQTEIRCRFMRATLKSAASWREAHEFKELRHDPASARKLLEEGGEFRVRDFYSMFGTRVGA